MSDVRIALVGLGAAARSIHVPAYRMVQGLELVGGFDSRADVGDPGFPVFDSLERMLETARPDIVTVATPTASHFELCSRLLDAGVHVLCEKPFATTLEEAAALVTAARARDRLIAVNNEFRFMRCHQAARQAISDGRLGELVFVDMHQTFHATEQTESGWRGQDDERTCKEFGTHVFDLCRFYFGEEPVRLHAFMPRPGGDGPDMLNLFDLEFSRDRFARITLDRLHRGPHRYLNVRLDGTQATIETEMGGRLDVRAGLRSADRRPFLELNAAGGGQAFLYHGERRSRLAREPLNVFAHATAALMRGYLRAIAEGTEPPCSGSDNLRTFALMRGAYEAAAGDRRLDLAHLRDLP